MLMPNGEGARTCNIYVSDDAWDPYGALFTWKAFVDSSLTNI